LPSSTELCIVCKQRKQRYVNKTCEPCNALVDAEGTHDLFGVSKKTVTQQRWEQQVKEYNHLIRTLHTQKQIADMWGLSLSSLRNLVYRWKSRGGLKVVPGLGNGKRVPGAKPKKPTAEVNHVVNEHGGGKWGKKGCTCDPCTVVRRHARMLQNRKYRLRRKQLNEQAKGGVTPS
jgi:hypothetical protein